MSRAALVERAPHLPAGQIDRLRIDGGPRLHCGAELCGCEIGYEVWGPADAPVIAVLGGISANRHVAANALDGGPGWWQPVVGPGRGVDTRRFRVLSIDYLGGAGTSTGPHTQPGFPAVYTRDQAQALAAVLDHLCVPVLYALVGASYGGMVALAFSALYAARVERLVAIGAAHRAHPMGTAVRAIQRDIVRLGIEAGAATRALALARALAITTYRSAAEFAVRFETQPLRTRDRVRFPVQDYLDHCGARFAAAFPPECFLRLSESIDLHDVVPEEIEVPATLVSIDSDSVAPAWQVRELAARLAGPVSLIEARSVYGHDAFLKEVDLMRRVLREALEDAGKGVGAP